MSLESDNGSVSPPTVATDPKPTTDITTPNPKPPRSWQFGLTTGDGIAVSGLLVTIGLVFGQWWFSDLASRRQKEQNMIQIAVGILSQRPPESSLALENPSFSEGEKVLRRWAVDLVNRHADDDIADQARDSLVSGQSTLRWNTAPGVTTTVKYDEKGNRISVTEDKPQVDFPGGAEPGTKKHTVFPIPQEPPDN